MPLPMKPGTTRRRPAGGMAGFTYISILFAIAIFGAGLAAAGVVWHTAAAREKERELLFIGGEFRRAFQAYTSRGAGLYPRTLSDLIEDRRFPNIQRHLRRIYTDPMTGRTEWGLVRAPDGGIMGVHSLSQETPIKTANFDLADKDLEGKTKYSEWKFVYSRSAPVRAMAAPVKPRP